MSSFPAHLGALPYAQRVEAILRAPQLFDVINLGSHDWDDELGESAAQQDDYGELKPKQRALLVLKLQTQTNVTCLNLNGNAIQQHEFISSDLHELLSAITKQQRLQRLALGCTS
jgi:hypothetical protein